MSPSPAPTASDPKHSPSYPQRVHIRERAHWQGVLQSCESRVAQARSDFAAMPAGPKRDACAVLLAQMSGARDQVADAARRLPMEVGEMYEEDKHRLEQAVTALERVMAKWQDLAK